MPTFCMLNLLNLTFVCVPTNFPCPQMSNGYLLLNKESFPRKRDSYRKRFPVFRIPACAGPVHRGMTTSRK
jgi:hypothetical protein